MSDNTPVTYRAEANVLKLRRGDVFTSSDPWYAQFVTSGYLSVVEDAEGAQESLTAPLSAPEEQGGSEPHDDSDDASDEEGDDASVGDVPDEPSEPEQSAGNSDEESSDA